MNRAERTLLLLMLALLCAAPAPRAAAQTITVSGTVATPVTPVRGASVTFEDAGRGAVFSTVTDSLGQYRLSLTLTSVDGENPLPAIFELAQNYPNPFSSATAIPYALGIESGVRFTIYDILGRVVREDALSAQSAGAHQLLWDGSNARGQRVAPGVYFYSLQAGGKSQVRKMVMSGGIPGRFSAGGWTLPPAAAGSVAQPSVPPAGFRLRVENGGSTFPLIGTKQVDSISLAADTTINISVENQYPIPVAEVSPDSLQQVIRGFGGANIIPWRPAMTASQIATAFGSGSGQLGLSILRLRIPYTDNVSEFAPNLTVAQLAQAQGAIVFASPWTPAAEMKSNNNIVGGVLKATSYAAYAAHLKTFADYMAANGAPLTAVSVQNEPDASVTYESCSWNATQFLAFMRDHAASIGTRVMMPEAVNFNHLFSDSTLNDPVAAANVGIIGGHIYGGGIAPYPLAVSKGKEVWMTEHLELDTTWAGVIGTGKEIHDCMAAGWNAYLWWYIMRYYGPMDEAGSVTKRGYVMSQFSRFVRPGYIRIQCGSRPQQNVYLTAYKDSLSGRAVLVALNLGSSPVQQEFSIPGGGWTSFTPYLTTRSKSCWRGTDLPFTGGRFTATLEGSSITTFVAN